MMLLNEKKIRKIILDIEIWLWKLEFCKLLRITSSSKKTILIHHNLGKPNGHTAFEFWGYLKPIFTKKPTFENGLHVKSAF